MVISYFTKRPKLKKYSFRIGIGMIFFFTNAAIFSEFVRLWEPEGKKIEAIKHYDCAIVLGGMAEYDNNLQRLSIRRGADRIWQTIHLYHLGKVDKILISSANGDLIDKGLNEAVQFRDLLVQEGIPTSDILIDSVSQNTHQNAEESVKILNAHPEIKSIVLVTSALHMPRAKACFEKSGLKNFDTFTTDHFTGKKRGYNFSQLFIPNISIMGDWDKLIHEWIGYLVYDIVGYI